MNMWTKRDLHVSLAKAMREWRGHHDAIAGVRAFAPPPGGVKRQPFAIVLREGT
ncbi:hypothetical protein LC55x_0301 [Lysobacter capsici]|nr:hypothetical protein LC55x_0301 [Lysobacter capsici]